MTTLIDGESVDASTPILDCTPALFAALADDREVWLRRIFTFASDVMPVLIACQQMAGNRDVLNPPREIASEFRVARIGDTTFDLEGRLFGPDDEILARATSVIAVAESRTSKSTTLPTWLLRTLAKKSSNA